MSGTGRGVVSPLGWARHWALIHDEALTIAPASKEDIAISLRAALPCAAKIHVTLLLHGQPWKHKSL